MASPNMLTCANCGSSAFVTPDQPSNSSMVTCKSCGNALGTVAEIQAAAKLAIAGGSGKIVKEEFRDAFKNLPSIRVQ